jgi:hypothetical protein
MSEEDKSWASDLGLGAFIVACCVFVLWYFFGRPGEVLPPQWATVESAGVTMTNKSGGIWIGVDIRLADGRKMQIRGVRALADGTQVCVRGAMPRGSTSLSLRLLPEGDCAGL